MTVQSYDGTGDLIPSGVTTIDGLTQAFIKFAKREGGPASGRMNWSTAANPSLETDFTTVDLYGLGFTQETIDAGGVGFAASCVYGAWETPIGGNAAHNWTGSLRFSGYGQLENGDVDYSAPVGMKNLEGVVQTSMDISGTGFRLVKPKSFIIQPGTRYVVFVGTAYHALPLFSYVTARAADWVIFGGGETVSSLHCNVDRTLGNLPDANPAQIIYECMINPTFGKGEDPAMIDTGSFLNAAVALRDEFFGLSMGWFAQDTIEKFIQEVLDHIQAFLFQDPGTGKWVLKLLRDDYTLVGAMHIDSSNADMTNQKREGME
ncbi:tail assembly protein [Synechococcus virus S-ESS1]|uniref:Tail assembly protein n=1 Tax=Synechococcus virus S-ESS1 TaxID=1964565 RepID=A0A1V0DX66_9CAUD|nr:tail protein [Synechococcus virus S-ESS1]ARB05697.1 tail assembly protein [Synechococcus virus S-ESS1]